MSMRRLSTGDSAEYHVIDLYPLLVHVRLLKPWTWRVKNG